jgi:hypothetical protein
MSPASDNITFLPRTSGRRHMVPAAAAVHLVDSPALILRTRYPSIMGAGSIVEPLE